MLQHLLLVAIQLQLLQDQRVALNGLGSGKAYRQPGERSVVLNQVDYGVNTPVHGTAVVVFVAKVLLQRRLLLLGHMNGVANQLVYALILGGGDGNDRHPQHGLHGVYINRAAVAHQLIHHIQRNDHGYSHFQQLHGQIQVALNVGGVHNVDDGRGLILQYKVAGDDLLAAEGRHGIDARQVRNLRVWVAANGAAFAVHGYAGKVAHMLLGTGQLVKQGGLAAVLVAHQCIGQHGTVR